MHPAHRLLPEPGHFGRIGPGLRADGLGRLPPQVWQNREPSRNSLPQRGQVSAMAGTASRTMISSPTTGAGGRQNSCGVSCATSDIGSYGENLNEFMAFRTPKLSDSKCLTANTCNFRWNNSQAPRGNNSAPASKDAPVTKAVIPCITEKLWSEQVRRPIPQNARKAS